MKSEAVVVKIGGAAGVQLPAICEDIADLVRSGMQIILVHGGSAQATELGEQLGYPPRFVTSVSGHSSRFTDARTLEIFLMATGLLNRRIVAQLQQMDINAAGLSGLDGKLLLADRKDVLRIVDNGKRKILRGDNSGSIRVVDVTPLRAWLDAGLLPVVAPVAISKAGEPLNVDGDRAAARIAAALGVGRLVILSNVPGLLRDIADESSRVLQLSADELDKALENLAKGRMKRKLIGVREALAGGVEQITLADGRVERPVTRALAGEGTVIK